MSDWTTVWTPERVQEADDPNKAFANYVQQTLGVPYPTIKDMTILRKKTKLFFQNVPDADWKTLCKVVQWAKARKRRPPRVFMVVEMFRDAWAAGYLPELDRHARVDETVEAGIERALAVETRPEWRARLLGASGVTARAAAFAEWQQTPQPV